MVLSGLNIHITIKGYTTLNAMRRGGYTLQTQIGLLKIISVANSSIVYPINFVCYLKWSLTTNVKRQLIGVGYALVIKQ